MKVRIRGFTAFIILALATMAGAQTVIGGNPAQNTSVVSGTPFFFSGSDGGGTITLSYSFSTTPSGVSITVAGCAQDGTNCTTLTPIVGSSPYTTAASGQQQFIGGYAQYKLTPVFTGGTLFIYKNAIQAKLSPSSGSPPYTGLVAGRSQVAQVQNSGLTWIMAQSYHYAKVPLTSFTALYGNYSAFGGGGEANAGTATYKVSVQYPLGTFTLCSINGSTAAVSVASGADAVAICQVTIPQNAQFWMRVLYQNPSGIIFTAGGSSNGPTNGTDGSVFGTGTASDLTAGGSISFSQTAFLPPSAIVGPTSQPSVCLSGDSRQVGTGDDLFPNSTGDTGQIARIVSPAFAYAKLASQGETLSNALTHYTARSRILAYCTHVIDAYGINDLTAGNSASTLASNRASFAANFGVGKVVYGTTVPSVTSSTDSWLTIANQTVTTNASAFNALVAAGIVGEQAVIDVAKAQDPLGLNKWPVSPIAGATTGAAANYATTDGTHETGQLNQAVAQLLGYVANWIRR